MAKITSKKANDYLAQLEKLTNETDSICKHAVYEGAKVVADAIKQSIDALPVQAPPAKQSYFYLSQESRDAGEKLHGISEAQKKGLQEGFGITNMRHENGAWNVKIGFEGYNEVQTKTYPNGQPNALIARSVESGSSVREKTPFIAPAVNACRKNAQKTMEVVIQKQIEAITKK